MRNNTVNKSALNMTTPNFIIFQSFQLVRFIKKTYNFRHCKKNKQLIAPKDVYYANLIDPRIKKIKHLMSPE